MRGLLHHLVLSCTNCSMRAQNTWICFGMFSFSLIFNVCNLFWRCIFITYWDSNNLVNSLQAWSDVGDEILLSMQSYILKLQVCLSGRLSGQFPSTARTFVCLFFFFLCQLNCPGSFRELPGPLFVFFFFFFFLGFFFCFS